MIEFVATPIGLIINHYSVVVSVKEAGENREDSIQQAVFIEVAFYVVDEETGEEFYSLANTYSMN